MILYSVPTLNVEKTNDDNFRCIHSTSVINGRKQALADAYSRRLNAKHTLYCITGEELVKSYKPFVPLLRLFNNVTAALK